MANLPELAALSLSSQNPSVYYRFLEITFRALLRLSCMKLTRWNHVLQGSPWFTVVQLPPRLSSVTEKKKELCLPSCHVTRREGFAYAQRDYHSPSRPGRV